MAPFSAYPFPPLPLHLIALAEQAHMAGALRVAEDLINLAHEMFDAAKGAATPAQSEAT